MHAQSSPEISCTRNNDLTSKWSKRRKFEIDKIHKFCYDISRVYVDEFNTHPKSEKNRCKSRRTKALRGFSHHRGARSPSSLDLRRFLPNFTTGYGGSQAGARKHLIQSQSYSGPVTPALARLPTEQRGLKRRIQSWVLSDN